MSPSQTTPAFGALVISLDFELHWGVRDKRPADGPYRENLLGAREAIPRMLDLFEEFGVAATWATVGFLFAKNRREREEFSPSHSAAIQKSETRRLYRNNRRQRRRRSDALRIEPDRAHRKNSKAGNRHPHVFALLLPGIWRDARSIRRRYRQRRRDCPP